MVTDLELEDLPYHHFAPLEVHYQAHCQWSVESHRRRPTVELESQLHPVLTSPKGFVNYHFSIYPRCF